jgi:hypothetical protein
MLSKLVQRPALLRAAAIVLPAAVLATAVAVVPSFAGSFLTNHKAKRIYLTKKSARHDYLKKRRAPDVPLTDSVASTALFGPVSSEDPVDVSGSSIELDVAETSRLALTFSGVSSCTASTDGVPCRVAVLVDGQPASTGNVDFDVSGNQGPGVHTLVQTSIVTAGDHTISVQYAGSDDPSASFKLVNWNLVVQGLPTS